MFCGITSRKHDSRKEMVISFIEKENRTPDRPNCCARKAKILFCDRAGRTVLIMGLVIAILAAAVAVLYHFGLLQAVLNQIPFINASFGPAVNAIWLPWVISASMLGAIMGVGIIIDAIKHWKDIPETNPQY